jgi:DNA-binding CsgD family transcriptional regulator
MQAGGSDGQQQGKARQGKARQGKARQGKARQGKARQGKARQGKARQGKARHGSAGHGSDIAGIVEAAMEAAVDSARWPVLLNRLTTAMDGAGAMITGCSFTQPERGFIVASGLDEDLSRLYIERYQDNPLSRAMVRAPLGKTVDQWAIVDRFELNRSEFHHVVLNPQKVDSLIAVNLPIDASLSAGGVGVAMSRRSDRTRRNAVEVLDAVAPYLKRAAVSSMLLRDRADLSSAFDAVLNQLGSGVLIVPGASLVLYANARAQRLLTEADGLDVSGGLLVSARRADTQVLHTLIHEAAQAGLGTAPRSGGSCAVARPSGRRALAVTVSPAPDLRDRMSLHARPSAIVFITDPEDDGRHQVASAARLKALYGLTPTEARVAIEIAKGHSVPEAAQRLSMGAGTAQTHLKRVFDKTGARRQSSLARLLTRNGVLDLPGD